jgi:hypothetical protein
VSAGGRRTPFYQQRDHLFIALPRGHVQRGVALGVLRVERRPAIQQQLDHLRVSQRHRPVERCEQVVVAGGCDGAAVQQGPNHGQVAARGGAHEELVGTDALAHRRRRAPCRTARLCSGLSGSRTIRPGGRSRRSARAGAQQRR